MVQKNKASQVKKTKKSTSKSVVAKKPISTKKPKTNKPKTIKTKSLYSPPVNDHKPKPSDKIDLNELEKNLKEIEKKRLEKEANDKIKEDPRRVNKQLAAIIKLIHEGKLKESDIGSLVGFGIEEDAVKLYNELMSKSNDEKPVNPVEKKVTVKYSSEQGPYHGRPAKSGSPPSEVDTSTDFFNKIKAPFVDVFCNDRIAKLSNLVSQSRGNNPAKPGQSKEFLADDLKKSVDAYAKHYGKSSTDLMKEIIAAYSTSADGYMVTDAKVTAFRYLLEQEENAKNTDSSVKQEWKSDDEWFENWKPQPVANPADRDFVIKNAAMSADSAARKSKIEESFNSLRVETFETKYASAHAAYIAARRQMLEAKNALNKAYKDLGIEELKD